MSAIKLFCLPYAGGSARFYLQWSQFLGSHAEVIPVELSGRGARRLEPLFSKFDDLVDDVFNNIKDCLDTPYAIFGHSMGCLVTFKLYHKISENGLRMPSHLFFSACRPPHLVVKDHRHVENMSEEELAKAVYDLGGIPKEIYEHEKLLKKILKVMRHDYLCIESFGFTEQQKRLNCDFTILGGTNDGEASVDNLKQWEEYAGRNCTVQIMEGDHFYIFDHAEAITQTILNKLAPQSVR